ncbi:MAG: dihydroorotase family protein [Microbacterium sp.]|uniref:dihydroorotase n=1 Tax=Microbacterium sp. TaxID=51671 RepID=UPI0039E4B192
MSPRLVRGDVVTPTAVLRDGGLVVDGENIVETLAAREAQQASAVMPVDDHRGAVLFPGVVDAHVHSYSDPGETFGAATRSAAAGGVTTIIDMPYDAFQPVNTRELLEQKAERIAELAVVDVALHGTVAPGTRGVEVAAMVDAGACGFKVSMFNTDPFRFPRIDNAELRDILLAGREAGVTIGVHAEDGEIIGALVAAAIAAGRTSPIDHCRSRPTESETIAVAAGAYLAAATGARFHVFHASTPETAAVLVAARAAGADVTSETCPHYLVVDETDMARLGARGKINPPLRAPAQVARNWELLAEGGFDMVTSDHAPWAIERKSKAVIFDNASGAPGVQTLAPLILGEGWLGGRMGLLRCAQVLAENPASRFNLGHRKGRLAAGFDADYVVFDPRGRTVIRAEEQLSTAGWTPYEGVELAGSIVETVVRGRAVYRAGAVVAPAGAGSYVAGRVV